MTNINDQNTNPDGEISMKDLILKLSEWWKYLLSKWVIIISAGIVCGSIGLIYASSKKTIYKAELNFAIQDSNSGGLSGAMGLASQFGISLGGAAAGDEFSGENLLGLMRSRSIIEKTLLTNLIVNGKKETLAEFYIDFNKLREGWKKDSQLYNLHFLPDIEREKFSLKQDSILNIFYKSIVANNLVVDKVEKKLSIISLKVNSTNELFSKNLAEVLAKVVSEFYVQTKTKKATQNVMILQRQTDSIRRALNSAISGVAQSMDAAPNANPALQTLHVTSQRRQFDVQANTAILSELVKNLEVAKMSLLQDTPLIQVIDRPILPLEKERLNKLKAIIVGGIIGLFIALIILVLVRYFKNVMSN